MKKLIISILVIAVIVLSVFLFMQSQGHDVNSILNTPSTLSVDISCQDPNNSMVTNVTVKNNSSDDLTSVRYKIVYFDKRGEKAGEKTGEFLRTLYGGDQMTKIVTLPLKAKTCNCIVTGAD